MIRTAGLAARALGPAATAVSAYVESRLLADGGFAGRDGRSDLYYTAFALDSLAALNARMDGSRAETYVHGFGVGTALDFVHRTSLARCWARLPGLRVSTAWRRELAHSLEVCRAPDGGFHTVPTPAASSVTGTFLALGAYSDLGIVPPAARKLVASLDALRSRDGAFANEPGMKEGTTLASAGVIILRRRLRLPFPAELTDWLEARGHRDGGFLASPSAPFPDLLSTATALYALLLADRRLDRSRLDACLAFIEGLQEPDGGFCGQWTDTVTDTEYTFYALLSLGCLTEMAGAR
jgi:hypothetical protein